MSAKTLLPIDAELLSHLRCQAQENERRRIHYDLRTTCHDTSQRMLNILEPDTKVPIHRHCMTSETMVCLEGCLDEVLYEPRLNASVPSEAETWHNDDDFVEVGRCRVCPSEGKYGVQVPPGVWHTVVVHEPSAIFEAKDGAYEGM